MPERKRVTSHERETTVPALSSEEQASKWNVFGEETIYENPWVTVALADVQPPVGERFQHHKVYLPPAAVLAMLDDQDRVFLMWRHRFISDTWNWELPGGVVDAGEDPGAAAAREAMEETGYRLTGDLEHVVTFQPMIGTVASAHHVYVARGVEKAGEPTEKNEAARTEWIPLDHIPVMIAQGLIQNSGTLVAVLHLLATRDRA
ncbi:NUDIX hydrolase [Streptomyces sp. Edi2]|uniref:NUDIX hydrolase n=1 Tax=Streptomyces sp. Edi2 TaxID=3162528 RepID=UPI0033055D9F